MSAGDPCESAALRSRVRRLELALQFLLRATRPLVLAHPPHTYGCQCKHPACQLRHEAELTAEAILSEDP